MSQCLRSLPGLDRGAVVAVSGGPDSVALVRAVLAVRTDLGIGPLVLAHLNHQLRGPNSDADEAFVAELYRSLATEAADLVLKTERLDVAAMARSTGENLEAVARRLRYHWLARVASEGGCRWVATGHTADDQAETVLHRLLRGTGLQGLRGIAAQRELQPGVRLVRPLLHVRRADVEVYLAALHQDARHDASNDDRRYTRNRIRHDLLPLLAKEYNPGIVNVLARLACQAEELFRVEDEAAAALLAQAERPRAGAMLVFDAVTLSAAPRHLVRAAFRHLWQREGWPMDALGFDAWERLADLAAGSVRALDLPGSIHVVHRQTVVQVVAGR